MPSSPQGFITSDEFLTIPELSINPLAKRLAYVFESINFKEFLVRFGSVCVCAGGRTGHQG